MKKIFLLMFVILVFASSTALAATVSATGEGPNKEQALATALRRAVEQGVGTFIKSSTTVVDSELVDDKILSHSKGYVTSYKITRESRSAENIVITITANVDSKILKDDLDALTILRTGAIVGNPRILVVFNTKERVLQGKPFTEEIYNGIVEALTDKQFRVVDKEAADSFSNQMADTHEIDINLNKAAAYGLKYQAEYTLFYNVSGMIRQSPSDKSVQLNIKTQLIDNTRAQVITNKRIQQGGSGSTVEQALDNAGRDGGKKIVDPMLEIVQKHWVDQQQNGATYTIVIDGVDDPEQIAKFTEMFEKFPLSTGAKEVESGGGKTTFEARYRGKRDQLDRDVLRTAKELNWVMKKIRAEGARSTWKRI